MSHQLSAMREKTNSSHLRLAILALTILALGVFLYASAVKELVAVVLNRQGSSHGVFVPFIAGVFLWINRGILRRIEPQYDYLGVPLVAIALLSLLLKIEPYQIQFLGFILLIAGLVIICFGREFFREISFPLFFLVTMIPLPQDVYSALADNLRHITLTGALWIISIFGIPLYNEGLTVHLPNSSVFVDISCSGIRYLMSYFVFSLAYAYLYRKTTKHRLIIIVSAIPVSLIAGTIRLTAIFSLTYVFGPQMAEHRPHVFMSWAVFLLVLSLCIGLDRFLHFRQVKGLMYQTNQPNN